MEAPFSFESLVPTVKFCITVAIFTHQKVFHVHFQSIVLRNRIQRESRLPKHFSATYFSAIFLLIVYIFFENFLKPEADLTCVVLEKFVVYFN